MRDLNVEGHAHAAQAVSDRKHNDNGALIYSPYDARSKYHKLANKSKNTKKKSSISQAEVDVSFQFLPYIPGGTNKKHQITGRMDVRASHTLEES